MRSTCYWAPQASLSISRSRCFSPNCDVPRPNPPRLPSLAITLWHGMTIGSRFLAIVWPAARGARALPAWAASHPYVRVSPKGMARHAVQAARENMGALSTSRGSSANVSTTPLKYRTSRCLRLSNGLASSFASVMPGPSIWIVSSGDGRGKVVRLSPLGDASRPIQPSGVSTTS